jgi:hypothetical protein
MHCNKIINLIKEKINLLIKNASYLSLWRKNAVPGFAREIADASDASVVEAVRRVQLDAAPLAAAGVERGAAEVAQDAAGLSADAHALSNAVDVHGPAAAAVPLSRQHRGPQAGRAKHRDPTLAVSLRNTQREFAAFESIEIYLQLVALAAGLLE